VESSGKAWGGCGVVRQWSSAPLCSCRCGKPHPSSTLRAVARRRGGGCRGARHRRTALVHPPSTRRAVARRHGVVLGLCPLASSSSSFPVARVVVVPPRPTHELLLVRLGVGGVASFVVLFPCCCRPSSSLPFHPRSTPRAVARGAGGGWCVIRHVVLVLVSLGVTRPVAPEPPCEQVLAAVGAGAGVCHLSSPSLPGMVHTCKPPYEQLLVGVVAGAVSSPRRRLAPLPLSLASSSSYLRCR
jgi:hypothetical protein